LHADWSEHEEKMVIAYLNRKMLHEREKKMKSYKKSDLTRNALIGLLVTIIATIIGYSLF